MIKIEFHCHTIYSKDCLTKPQVLLEACRRKGIQRVVVTDHDTIAGAVAASQIDPQRVIVGEEIMTRQGELLAAFVKEGIPAGLPAKEAIRLLREQEAFISVSHPFDSYRKGHWEPEDLIEISPLVDAIEVFNARCLNPTSNRKAQVFASQHDLPGTVGSDAHTVCEFGYAIMELPDFDDSRSLRQSLSRARFHVKSSSPLVHLASRYAHWVKKSGWINFGNSNG